jgi:hypothetical protein
MPKSTVVCVLALFAWAVSWFVSPHEQAEAWKAADSLGDIADSMLTPGAHEHKTSSEPPGWTAARLSWNVLTGRAETKDKDAWKRWALGLGSVTNAAMLLAALALFMQRGGKVLGWLLLACAAVNASWLYATDAEFRSGLQAGYWLWLGSFALAGAGFLARSRPAPA